MYSGQVGALLINHKHVNMTKIWDEQTKYKQNIAENVFHTYQYGCDQHKEVSVISIDPNLDMGLGHQVF